MGRRRCALLFVWPRGQRLAGHGVRWRQHDFVGQDADFASNRCSTSYSVKQRRQDVNAYVRKIFFLLGSFVNCSGLGAGRCRSCCVERYLSHDPPIGTGRSHDARKAVAYSTSILANCIDRAVVSRARYDAKWPQLLLLFASGWCGSDSFVGVRLKHEYHQTSASIYLVEQRHL